MSRKKPKFKVGEMPVKRKLKFKRGDEVVCRTDAVPRSLRGKKFIITQIDVRDYYPYLIEYRKSSDIYDGWNYYVAEENIRLAKSGLDLILETID